MTDVRQLSRQANSGQRHIVIYSGTVSLERTPPATFSDPIWVICPSHSPDTPYGPLSWPAVNGATLPVAGTQVWVGIDDQGTPFVLDWDGDYTNPAGGLAVGGVLTGTLPDPGMAAGAAATNVGALGGVLAGTLPDPTFAATSGALASLQNGVLNSGDCLISSATVNNGSGAITFTLAAGSPMFVTSVAGILTPVAFAGVTAKVLTPATLPTSGNTLCVGVEVDTSGNVTLVEGSTASGNLAISAVTSPATSSGKIRVADFALANVSGFYQFGSTSTFTQGTNWYDRRPWSRGADEVASYTSGTVNIPNGGGFTPLIATNRLECTGVPMVAGVIGSLNINLAYNAQYALYVDGAVVLQQQIGSGSGSSSTSDYFPLYPFEYVPTAGTHLFQVAFAQNGPTSAYASLLCTSTYPVTFVYQEQVRQNTNNGIS